MTFTNEEKPLLLLYYEDGRQETEQNLREMRKQLQADEKHLIRLTDRVLGKLHEMSEEEFRALELFPDTESEVRL